MDEVQAVPATLEKPKSKVVVVLLSVLLVALAMGNAYFYKSWQNSKSQLKTSQAQLAAKANELQKVTAQLGTFRDTIRKADLASFADVIRAYNAKNHSHLTTEGTISKSIYDTQLSKSISNFTDPKTGETYDFIGIAKVQSPPPLKIGVIQYQWPGKCGDKTIIDSNDDTQSVVATLLEDGSMYCLSI